MPTINLTELFKIGVKIGIIAILAGLIISFVGDFVQVISSVISKMSGSGQAINGLNLGWFANAIGLVSFLNSLMQSLYFAGTILISGVVTIFSFKYGIKFYTYLVRV